MRNAWLPEHGKFESESRVVCISWRTYFHLVNLDWRCEKSQGAAHGCKAVDHEGKYSTRSVDKPDPNRRCRAEGARKAERKETEQESERKTEGRRPKERETAQSRGKNSKCWLPLTAARLTSGRGSALPCMFLRCSPGCTAILSSEASLLSTILASTNAKESITTV
jgi:hypothetical protein